LFNAAHATGFDISQASLQRGFQLGIICGVVHGKKFCREKRLIMRIQLRDRRLNFFDRAHANNLGQTFADAKGKVQFASADNSAIDIDQINDAYERVLKSDVKYRSVIDMAKTK
jgi:D-arabinose 1-dehydrogenase-like Zn-dependent alcohol dehydrogenase